jgi:hypothetical protein
MPPWIANPRQLELPGQIGAILAGMFPDHEGVVIESELTAFGYSGGRVFRIHLLKGDDAPELPLAVKVATPSLIEREVRAYHECVRHQWPDIAELYGSPVYLHEHDIAGLCYSLMGGGVFETQSLREYCLAASADDVRFVLEARLFRLMEQRMLRPARSVFEYPLVATYDRVLPVNLLVDPGSLDGERALGTAPLQITPDALPYPPPECGTPVRLEGFVVSEIHSPQRQVTLDLPPGKPPNAYRLRLHPVEDLSAYVVGQVIPPTEGTVSETRQSRLAEEVARIMGTTFDPACEAIALPEAIVFPNPLRAIPDILNQTQHIRVNYIHGDMNLENVMVDPQVRDVRLIDFADARRDHVLLDFLRLEAEVVTKLLPVALVEAQLPPTMIAMLYGQLHHATFEPGRERVGRMPHPALEKIFVMLCAIRKAAHDGLYKRGDYSEYYQGLILLLLGTLKFDTLDALPEAPLPKQVAFLGAATLQQLLWPECVAHAVPQQIVPEVPLTAPKEQATPAQGERLQSAAPAAQPAAPPKEPFLRRKGAFLALTTAIIAIAISIVAFYPWPRGWPPWRPGPLDISPLCAIEEQLAIPISMNEPNRYSHLLLYYREANPELFARVDSIAQAYESGQAHREATYVMGGPGVGKSYVAAALDQFPEADQCTIRMGELADSSGQGIAFKMVPDLATLGGEWTFNELPTFADPEAFSLDSLLAAGGCVRHGQIAPLVIIDDLNEVHDESISLILKEIEAFISQPDAADSFVHILVFGRPEAFAPWLRQYRRRPPRELQVSEPLEGGTYTTSGDLEMTYSDCLDYRRMPAPSQEELDAFVQLVVDHPFLTYSIRILAVRNFVIEASQGHVTTEQKLKTSVYNSLIERDRQVHGRGIAHPLSYQYLLEDIAARYLDQVDDEGFFVVNAGDTIQVYDDDRKNVVGEVDVRTVLDRSGITRLRNPASTLARYRFDPFWIQAYLVEQRNQYFHPGHEYVTCEQLSGSHASATATLPVAGAP